MCVCAVYMKAMYIPEAYYNKTPLDGHFAVAGRQMRASVCSGKLDAFDAASMFRARVSDSTKGEGATNYVVHFEPNRDCQCLVKGNKLQGLKMISARIPVWVQNTPENKRRLKMEDIQEQHRRCTMTQLREILCARGTATTGESS